MANTVIALKKSGTPSAIPVDLANGEIAINYADGKIFYKSAAGSIQEISGGGGGNAFGTVNANGTLIVSDTTGDVFSLVPGDNITITGDSINDKITIGLSSDVILPGVLYIKPVGGDEGGQIELGNAVTNSTLTGNVVIDIYQNKLRFYEKNNPNKGAFIDLSIAGSGVSSNLLAGGTGTGADTFARETANTAYDKANSANLVATSSYDQSNTNSTIITASFGKANDAQTIAIASFDKVNAVAIGANSYADTVGAGANAWVSANFTTLAAGAAAYDYANSVGIIVVSAFDKANAANLLAYDTGAGANSYADMVGTSANAFASATIAGSNTAIGTGANTYASEVGVAANAFTSTTIAGANNAVGSGANAYADIVGTSANSYLINIISGANTAVGAGANSYSDAVGSSANSYLLSVISGANNTVGAAANAYADIVGISSNAFTSATIAGANTVVGTGANSYADIVGSSANAFTSAIIAGANAAIGAGANTVGSAAFDTANTKFSSSGGIINGSVSISGNLTVSGNTTFVSAQNLRIDDPLIYLAGNNYVSDIVDIGFIANYVNTTGSNVHTGIFRDAGSKEWYVFEGYDEEPKNNVIDPNGNNFTISVLNAQIKSSNITLAGQNVEIWIDSAYDKANDANLLAHNTGIGANAFTSATISGANTAVGSGANAFTSATIAGANTAVGAGANAYSSIVGSSANTFTSATIAGANAAVGAGANTVGSAAFSKANSVVQTGFVTVIANDTNLIAASNNDTLTLAASQNIAIIGNAGTDTATFDLTNTGVIASTYGSATIIPVIIVDAKGRITGISNVAIAASSGGGYFQGNNGDINSSNFGDIFRTHSNTFTGNVTIASGNNSIAAGPINIAVGAKLTIQDGARVSIV